MLLKRAALRRFHFNSIMPEFVCVSEEVEKSVHGEAVEILTAALNRLRGEVDLPKTRAAPPQWETAPQP